METDQCQTVGYHVAQEQSTKDGEIGEVFAIVGGIKVISMKT